MSRSRIVPHRSAALGLFLSVLLAAATAPTARAQEGHDHHGQAPAGPRSRHLGDGHSHEGFPHFVDVFFTHHAYLERKLHPRLDATYAELGNEFEGSGELAWQFNRWLGGEIEIPVVRTDPEAGSGAGGLGDVELAPMVALWQSPERLAIVSLRSGFALPTGDEQEGLGAEGWGWEPGLLLWKGHGRDRRGAIQAEIGYERLYADEGRDEEELVYNLAWSYWLPSNWIPIAELNGVTRLSDPPADEHEEEEPVGGLALAHGDALESEDDTVIAAALGFRYAFANGQQWGAGIQLPLSDTEGYDWRLVVGGIIHIE
ncbi:MAG TPA: transporter [Gemmatimonadota bacterium]|nr:transporter [Gemmatimonadota bacterium]